MGGRLSRKKRGYNVNDPKEGKSTAESPQDPEVKDDLENPDTSKEQVKKPEVELPEEKPETEAPKAASDAKPADLATLDVKTEEKATVDVPATDPVPVSDVQATVPATDPVLVSDVQATVPATDPVPVLDVQATVPATDPVPVLDLQATVPATDPVPVSDVPVIDHVQVLDIQASVPATDPVQVSDVPATDPVQASGVSAINLVKATEQSPEPVEHHLVTETVESSSTPDTGSSADTPDVPELSEGKIQTVLAVCEEAQAKPVLDKEMGMTSEDPSNETSSLGDHVATEIMKVEQLENSHLIPEDKDESEVIENQDNVSPQSTLKEVESALQETLSESGIEIPRLPITVETPIDIVLKNEIASCEKHVAGPDTRDEIQEKIVSETIHPTDQMVADVKIEPTEHSVKNSDCVQDSSVQEDSEVLADQSLAEGSGNLSVDTLRGTSVTDVVPVQSKDAMAECPPETVSTSVSAAEVVTAESTPGTKSNTVTETRCEQTPELISCQDGVKTPPLETSSEAIPDIKVTVYTEGLQEQIQTGTEPTKESTGDESLPECFVSDSEAHPPKLDSTVPGTASTLTFGEPSPTDVIKTQETSSMRTENGFSVDEQSQNESALKNEGDKLPDTSVVNGTPVDNGDQSKKSQVEVNSPSETIKAEENIQGISDSAVGSKSIEQVNTNPPAMESGCLKLDNQTVDSGL